MEDLTELRRLAEIVASHEPDFKDIREYLEALRNMQGELSGTTVLALLSRLEQAEQAVQRVREVATAMANHSLPEAPRGGAWETAHGAQLFAKDILRALDGDNRRLAGDALTARTTKNGDNK